VNHCKILCSISSEGYGTHIFTTGTTIIFKWLRNSQC